MSGLQSPVVISANCNYLLPAVRWRPTGYFLKSFCLSFLPLFLVGNLPFLGRALGIALPGTLSVLTSCGSGSALPKASRASRNWESNAVSVAEGQGLGENWSLILGEQALCVCIPLLQAPICTQQCEGSLCSRQM